MKKKKPLYVVVKRWGMSNGQEYGEAFIQIYEQGERIAPEVFTSYPISTVQAGDVKVCGLRMATYTKSIEATKALVKEQQKMSELGTDAFRC